jgi:hypothetical protein
MRHRTSRLRGAAAFAAIGTLLAAGACGGEGGADESGGAAVEANPDAVAEAERLYQIVNDSRRIEDELTGIEHRVAKRCLEDAGFGVHDPLVFQESRISEYGAAGYLSDAPDQAVPTPEAAEQWGFGVWAEFVHNPGNEDLAEELMTPEARTAFNHLAEGGEGPDTSEWDAQDPEYQAAWIEAWTGAPSLDDSMKGPERDSEAPMGGCQLEMVETMYGEPYTVEVEGGGEEGEDGSYTTTHRPSPIFDLEELENADGLLERLDGENDAFDSCLIDKGYEGWEIGDFNLPLWSYFGPMYDPAYFEQFGDEEGGEAPEGPDEVPSDFMGVLELERAMAVDFAACGQESGLRTAIEEGWAAMLVERYQPIETDMVAWQTEMQGHLDEAQEYLQE